jgi:hypothetical protein
MTLINPLSAWLAWCAGVYLFLRFFIWGVYGRAP